MRSILLINPPAPFLTYPNAAPHLGIGYMISYLRKHSFEVSYLNLENEIPADITIPEGYDFYGITSVSAQYYFAILLLNQIKQQKLGKTIIGGAHASVMPEVCRKDGFDYVVKGYGEEMLLQILCGNVPPGIYQGKLADNLDEIPFPSWDDLFKNEYNISYGNNVAHFFSMRGCPYECSYCSSVSIFGAGVGFRSINNVVAEVKLLKEKYNISKLYFLDPTFTLNRKRTIDLCKSLKDLDVSWTCETRVDRIDYKLLKIMQNAGCDLISFGIETGSGEAHNLLYKKTTIEQNESAISMAHDAGLQVKAFLMGALPDDNWKTSEEFKKFIISNKPDTWLYSTFIPFPGTMHWENPAAFGIRIVNKDFRAYYNLGLNGRGPVNIINRYLSRDELKNLRDDMIRFLMHEIPNPRVETAFRLFEEQKRKLLPYIRGMETEYLF